MKTITIEFTEEETKALITQVGARLDDLKALALEVKTFARVQELTEFIKPIQSAYEKLMNSSPK